MECQQETRSLRKGRCGGRTILGDPAQGDQAAIQWVEGLIEARGIATGLAHHGVDEEQLEALADLAIQDPCHQTNPISMTRDDFLTLYRQCL